MSLFFGYKKGPSNGGTLGTSGTYDDTKLKGWVLTQIAGSSTRSLQLLGGQMKGVIDMGDNEIKNLHEPLSDTSAVTKGYLETKIAQSGTSGLSEVGFTMKGDIDMAGHAVTGLSNPVAGNSAVPKDYVDNNFLRDSGILMEGPINMNNFEIKNVLSPTHGKSAVSKDYSDSRYLGLLGGTMKGNIDAGGYSITGIHDIPVSDGYAVNKKYVETTFAKKSEVLGTNGFTMTGPIHMGGYEITSLTLPSIGTSAVSKDYAESRYVIRFGDTMLGELNMGTNALIGLPHAYTDDSSAVSKKFIEGTFAKKSEVPKTSGFTMAGVIVMNGNDISNLNPVPSGQDSAVTKGWVEKHSSTTGLSAAGFTMTGPINMDGNEVTGLTSFTAGTSAVSRQYLEDNYLKQVGGTIGGALTMSQFEILDLAPVPTTDRSAVGKKWVQDQISSGKSRRSVDDTGFTMTGDIDMGGHKILNLNVIPQTGASAATKKWVEDEFPKKSQVLGGFVLSGSLDMNGNEILNLPDVPGADGSAVSKKYLGTEFARVLSGPTMTGPIKMGNHGIHDLLGPINDNDATNKKWVTDTFAKKTDIPRSGITQGEGDIRYVRKTKLTLAEWSWGYLDVGTTYKWPFRKSGWPESTRTDHFTGESNIEIKCITFDDEQTKAQISGATLEFKIKSTSAGDVNHDTSLSTVPLVGKSVTTLKTGTNTDVFIVHLDEEIYLGLDTVLLQSLAYNIGVKVTGLTRNPEIVVTYRFNESGRYG